MVSPETQDIIKIIRTYAYQNGMTLTEFARKSEVSKSWISRLKNEDADISLFIAQKMLNTAGYKIIIKHQSQINDGDTQQIKTLTEDEINKIDQGKIKVSKKSRLSKVIQCNENQ